MKKFDFLVNTVAQRYGVHRVFSDFLTLCVCSFSFGTQEKLYLETISRYEKSEAERFPEMLAALVTEMSENGTGFIDVLGKFFEGNVSHGKNGQFFTPMPVCELMAQLSAPLPENVLISDPACGSGRMILATAKYNRFARFYAADIDPDCCKMTVINMVLNRIYGQVVWMDSLSLKYFDGWGIFPSLKGVPAVRRLKREQSYLVQPEIEKQEISAKQMIFEF